MEYLSRQAAEGNNLASLKSFRAPRHRDIRVPSICIVRRILLKLWLWKVLNLPLGEPSNLVPLGGLFDMVSNRSRGNFLFSRARIEKFLKEESSFAKEAE